MVRIHGTSNPMEAHVFRTALAQYGIEARLRNEMLSSLAGAVPVTEVMVEVWVAAEQAAEAVSIIEEALSRPSSSEKDEDGRLSLTDGGTLSLVAIDAGILSAQRPTGPTRPEPVCSSCGETSPTGFEICWNCGTDLYEP